VNITEVRLTRIEGDKVKAMASITIDGDFVVRGLKVIEGQNGLFVGMPSYDKAGERKDVCFPITAEAKEQIRDAVLTEYRG
jgi:stage V sporulation protein G